ncbi:unnamed protein product [Macrosiphum euphorbiae]|uniref:HTH psq-type domain-containing protein n=1 Tax=Macrosiphum euphorbiae TaxID=13131 RepID=A0AAV0WM67_9HEMI|nr:unnamed protein product [Macrosiphum euphorbiae]
MPRGRKRTSNRQMWDSNNMRAAVDEIIVLGKTFREACEKFSVPKSTLERKVKKKRNDPTCDVGVKDSLGPRLTVFNTTEENELVSYLKLMEGRLFGLSVEDLKKLAYQLAEKNNITHDFSHVKKKQALIGTKDS